jgi:hypothetical protein
MLAKLSHRRLAKAVLVLAAAIGALVVPQTAANAAYGTQVPVNLQVRGSLTGQNIGNVSGYVQFDSGNLSYYYNLTVCRQSSYTVPYVSLAANSGPATAYYPTITSYPASCPSGQGTLIGTVSSASRLYYATISITGGDYQGSTYKQSTKSGTYYNPN